MLTARRRQVSGLLARHLDYDLTDTGRPVGLVSYEREQGAVEVGDHRYRIVSRATPTLFESFVRSVFWVWKDNFALLDGTGEALARADKKPGNVFTLQFAGEVFDIRHKQALTLVRVLEVRARPGAPVLGGVDYGVGGGKEMTATLPPSFPLAVQAFVIWMAIYCLQTKRVDN